MKFPSIQLIFRGSGLAIAPDGRLTTARYHLPIFLVPHVALGLFLLSFICSSTYSGPKRTKYETGPHMGQNHQGDEFGNVKFCKNYHVIEIQKDSKHHPGNA
ncbi:hypothetical protein NQ317_011276 [Molorchus minor]|uniref:Uncharacterized protein n=1 Tax=Molorchus minor TaxID=1323400 RepID=A0ABQ9JSP1_9CUCU|nr:hypothetical protein NQ317_011276 [Molorchus minor]